MSPKKLFVVCFSSLFASLLWIGCASIEKPLATTPEMNQDKTLSPTTPSTTSCSSASSIAIEAVATYPLPGTSHPLMLRFAPDGKHLTYLFSEDGSLTRELFAVNLESGDRRPTVKPPGDGETEENLSLEEKLQRERTRTRGLGITRYTWSPKSHQMLIPISGAIHVQDGLNGALREVIARGSAPALVPRFSPDGSQIAFVRNAEVHVVSSSGGAPLQLTKGAKEAGKTNGIAEFIAQEEMDRREGFWWSKDSKMIAFEEVDEGHIPEYRIVHQGEEVLVHEDHGYAFAGAENARVRLGVIPATGGEVRWMDLSIPEGPDLYLARVHWRSNGTLIAEVEDRAQQTLHLLQFDPKTGAKKTLLTERSKTWLNLHDLFHSFDKSAGPLADHFIWGSERSGFMHLYLYSPEGKLLRQLTEGEWMVDHIAGVDAAQGKVWFLGTKDGAVQSHLYEVALDGTGLRKITEAEGTHSVILDPKHRRFIDQHNAIDAPPSITLRALDDGRLLKTLHNTQDPKIKDLVPPTLVTLKNREGTTLHGAIYTPDPERFGPGPYPVIVSVYGGPIAQTVRNTWGLTVRMREQLLRDRGFLVFKLDNRGSARRGVAFESAVWRNLGELEVDDQVDGVRWLVSKGLADPAHVGIVGWSYGGYMALMALARAPETFHAGVSGAPVTHWDGYDTHYTERYMGTPANNPKGYEVSSVMHHVEAIKGELMLIHGLIDENVHFRHTARLINALIAARKPHELQLFPSERHMPRRKADRIFMEERILNFFCHNLRPQ